MEEKAQAASDSDSESDDDDKSVRLTSINKHTCLVCKRRTEFFCSGCRSWLCNQPHPGIEMKIKEVKITKKTKSPKKTKKGRNKNRKKNSPKQTKKVKKKYPEFFYVDVPVLDQVNGEIKTDSEGKPIHTTEYGVYTCYHIAHRKQWKKMLYNKQQSNIIHEIAAADDAAKKKKRKKGKKR